MNQFKRILVHIDSTAPTPVALEHALVLAGANRAAVHIIHVLEEVPLYARWAIPADYESLVVEKWTTTLDGIRAEKGDAVDGARLLRGKPSIELVREVVSGQFDIVVKERRIDDLAEDARLLRKCPCPVWLVSPDADARGDPERVLAAVDPNPDDPAQFRLAKDVLSLASSFAMLDGGELHVLHAWHVFGENIFGHAETVDEAARAKEGARQRVEALRDSCHCPVEPTRIELPRGLPERTIRNYVLDEDIDLVVMGTVGRTGVPGLLIGNTAEGVFQRVRSSILALKPDGFVSPIPSELVLSEQG